MGKKLRLTMLAIAVSLMINISAFAAINARASPQLKVSDIPLVKTENIISHIVHLSNNIGPRITGSEDERKAAYYIKSQLEQYGYNIKLQTYKIPPELKEKKLIYNNKKVEQRIKITHLYISGLTPDEGITASLIDCGYGNYIDEFPAEVKDNIALIKRGGKESETGIPYISKKIKNAEAAGAKAVIISNNKNEDLVFGDLGSIYQNINKNNDLFFEDSETGYSLPVVFISRMDGRFLDEETGRKYKVDLTLKVTGVERSSQNIIASYSGDYLGEINKKIIYVTSHYDSVKDSPGANDNASGTALMLEMARLLKEYQHDKEIRLIAFGAEEIGMVGSYNYVSQLTQEEIERSIANINLDMVGTGYGECFMLRAGTIDGKPNLITEKAELWAKLIGYDYYEVKKMTRSDHIQFYRAGIPCASFIWVDKNGMMEPYYHGPQDNHNINISPERLKKTGEIVSGVLNDILRQ